MQMPYIKCSEFSVIFLYDDLKTFCDLVWGRGSGGGMRGGWHGWADSTGK